MKVSVGAATDIGQVREGNEDSFLIVEPLYAVADGMGGHRGGEVASSLALETVQGMFERREGSLAEQVAEANRAVFDRSQSDRKVSGMGTTLTAAQVEGNRVHLVHVGDSRAYLLRGGELTQITEDHTLVHRMVMEGEISEEEAETHPHRSILTRALGVDRNIQVDEGDLEVAAGRPAPVVHRRPHRHGRRGADPGDPARGRRPAGGGREARQGRKQRRRHRQHHRRDPRLRG